MDKNLRIALILTAVDKASVIIGSAITRAEKHAKALDRSSKVFNEVGDKAIIAGGAITAFFGKTVQDARESEIANRRLEQVFKSMGKATTDAAKNAENYASKLQFKIGFEDETIEATQAKLATFKYLISDQAKGIDAFNRATALSFDLQAAGFGEATQNAVILGKALNNPALGATALKRIGALNAEDVPVIKHIQAAKGLAAAQEFVLKAVERQVKGVAESTADPIKKMGLEFHEASESIGRDLLPEVNKLANKLAEFVPQIISFAEHHKRLTVFVAKAGVALLAFGIAMKGVGFILSAFSTGYKLYSIFAKLALLINTTVIPVIARLSVAFIEFGATLLLNPITWYVAAALALVGVGYLIVKNWDKVKKFFTDLWTGPLNNTKVQMAIAAFLPFIGLPILIIKNWDKIKIFFSKLWKNISATFSQSVDWIMSLPHKMYDAGKNIIKAILDGMKSKWNDLKDWFSDKMQTIGNYFSFDSAKVAPIKDIHKSKIIQTVAQSITAKPLFMAMDNVMGKLSNYGHHQPISNSSNRSNSQMSFAPVIHLHGNASKSDADKINNSMRDEFKKMMREYESNKSRTGY